MMKRLQAHMLPRRAAIPTGQAHWEREASRKLLQDYMFRR